MVKDGKRHSSSIQSSRRRLLKGMTGAAGGAVALSGCMGNNGNSNSITFMGWGGNFGEAVQRTLVEPFNEEHDTTVEYVPLPDPAEMLSKLQAGSLGVDVVSHWNYTLYQGVKQDLFQPIRKENVPNIERIIDEYSPDEVSYDPGEDIHHIPNTIGGNGLVYNHDVMEEPNSWEDIFTEEYQGAVSLPGWATAAVGIVAKACGLGLGNSLPDNIDQVWNKMEEWNEYMYDWWGSGQDMQNYLQNEAVYAGMLWYARVNALHQNEDAPLSYTIPEEGTSMYIETYSIPKGVEGQKRRTVENFLNYVYSEERLKALVNEMPYTIPYDWEQLPSAYEDHPEYEYLGTDRLESWNSEVLENNRQEWSTRFREVVSR